MEKISGKICAKNFRHTPDIERPGVQVNSDALAITNPILNLKAARNLIPDVFKSLEKLGLTIVLVVFEGIKKGHPALNRHNIEKKLGTDLYFEHAGEYHSTFWLPDQHWHVYHVTDLAKAIPTLKAGLERRGLLTHAQIFTADSPNELSQWWPATAKRILYTE